MPRNPSIFIAVRLVVCSLVMWGGEWSPALQAQQELRGRTLRDADYCFELRAEDGRWQILEESRAQRTVPDSVAGLVAPMGRMSMVIVEPLPEGTLEDYRLLVRGSIGELMTIEDEQQIKYGGQKAIRIQFVGTISGAEFRFVRVLLLHKGFGYQIVAWGLSSDVGARGEQLQDLLDAFQITSGEPRTRVNEFRVRQYDDVGIEVKDGIFRSAISGITLAPPDDWRLVLGTELKQMNPDAEIGWAHEEGSVYGLVLAEAVEEASAEAYLEELDRVTLEELQLAYGELTPEPSVTMELFGSPIEFKVVTTEQLPRFRYYRAAVKRNGFAIRLLAWHFAGQNQWTESLSSVIGKLRLAEGDELSQLRVRLASRPDPQTMIGPGFSLREGLYQFFPLGLQWKKPVGMWRVLTPEDAATVNPDGLMIASDVQRGIWGMVIAENIEGLNLDDAQYHDLVMKGVFGEEHQLTDQVQEVNVGGQRFKTALGDQQFDGMSFRYRVATTVRGPIAYQVLVWGLKTNAAVQPESMDLFWKNLRWSDEALPATEEGVDGTYYDYRTGFSFKPPGFRWNLSEQMQPEIAGMGNQAIWNRPGQFVMAVAIQPDPTATEPTALSDLANQFLANAYGELLQQEPEITEANLDGVICEQRVWRGDRESVAAIVANRNKVTYFVVVFDATGKIDNLVDLVLQKFKFIGPEKVESTVPE
jgi:hypothetical protein